MILEGQRCMAELKDDKLCWDDGESWEREAQDEPEVIDVPTDRQSSSQRRGGFTDKLKAADIEFSPPKRKGFSDAATLLKLNLKPDWSEPVAPRQAFPQGGDDEGMF